jgi:hypothetical protein
LSNLKKTKIFFGNFYKNFDFKEKQAQIPDLVDRYSDCLSSCDMKDGTCISMCVEIIKMYDS